MVDPISEATRATQAEGEEWKPTKEFGFKSGDRPLEGYTIKRGLGRGGFGEVYYAISDGGKEVALKLIQRHLDVELRGVAQCLNLKNSNLVTVYDVRYNDRGENWVVMEYMAGPSLQERLQKTEGAFPIDEAFHWLTGIAAAIDYLHQNGIVHRDLKPGNVFGEGDLVKLGDYGLSKFISASRRSGQTESVGTVHYMAPEISTGHYGKSIDVYSAAVIAFEMLAGDVPFDGESAGEILMKHLTAAPALEKLDVKWRGVFAKALAKDPADRFATAGELLEALRAINRGEQPDFAPPRAAGAMGPPPMPRAGYAGADDNYRRYVQAIDRLHQSPPTTTDLETSLPPMPGTLKSKRRGLADTLWAMFMTAIMAAALPAFAYAIETAFRGDLIADPQAYVWIGSLTTILSWSVILFSKSWNHLNTDGVTRRVTLGLWGLAAGAGSLVLSAYVAGPLPRTMDDIVQIGGSEGRLSRPTYVLEYIWSHHRPELFQVALLFAALFVLPNWDKIGGSSRNKRFSLWQAIWVTSLALMGAGIFAEANGRAWNSFAIPLAASFSLTALVVQWASPFAPPLPAPRVANKLRRLRRTARPNYV